MPQQVQLDDRTASRSVTRALTLLAQAIGTNWWIRSPIWVKTRRKTTRRSLLGALGLGRVLVAPVERLVAAREDRADLARLVAHGDDVVERLARGTPSTDLERAAGRVDARPRPGRGSVSGLTPCGSVPALWTSKRSPPWWRRSASAMTLRAELPVHTNRTRIGSISPSVTG